MTSALLTIKAIAYRLQESMTETVRNKTFFDSENVLRVFTHNHRKWIIEKNIIKKCKADVFRPIADYKNCKPFRMEISQKNCLKIDIPSWSQLIYEHFFAPFFVFQIFCGILWCLDEYIYHSIFTLVMLFVFEIGVIFSRRVTMKHYRFMEQKEIKIKKVIFDKMEYSTREISSLDLVPGEILIIDRSIKIPADMIILKGACAVNEAMLTGESLPNYKEDITELKGIFEKQKKYVLFSGTEIVKIEPVKKIKIKNFQKIKCNIMKDANTQEDVRNENIDKSSKLSENGDFNLENTIQRNNVIDKSSENGDFHLENTGFSQQIKKSESLKIGDKIECYTFPEQSMVVMVIETGFNTQQGKSIRKMMNSSPPDNTEAYMFLLFLLVFAIISSVIVFHQSRLLKKTNYKIFLEIILILTNVVPPELPLELTIAVNAAVQKLLTLGVFCLEPFRIVNAGKVNIACFDKTGTLTESNMVLEKVILPYELKNSEILKSPEILKSNVQRSNLKSFQEIVLTCHSLLKDEKNQLLGDSLEISAFNHFKGEMFTDNKIRFLSTQKEDDKKSYILKIIKKFHFSSNLRRMTVVFNNGKSQIVGMKGAPETVEKFLKTIPSFYNQYLKFAEQGYRVLAIASAKLSEHISIATRENIEKQIFEFRGFLLYQSKLKEESLEVVKTLQTAGIKVIMITGDNSLTAISVARNLNFYNGSVMEGEEINKFLDIAETLYKQECSKESHLPTSQKSQKQEISNPDSNIELNLKEDSNSTKTPDSPHHDSIKSDNQKNTFTHSNIETDYSNLKKRDFNFSDLNTVIESFSDKEPSDILFDGPISSISGSKARKTLEKVTVFARADPKHKERLIRFFKNQKNITLMCGDGTNDVGALNESDVGIALLTNKEQVKKKPESFAEVLRNEMIEGNVNLGDACVAAPFTIRNNLLTGVLSVIRQGRSTLVTTFQMYKILALNSLITAYSLSFLDSCGVRFSDAQVTVSGVLLALAFMFLTKCEPLETISRQRPITNIFNSYFISSILLQTVVHLVTTAFLVFYIGKPSNYIEKFTPSLLNSSLYILNTSQQISTFMINYIGRPFREDFLENIPLRNSLFLCLAFVLVLASELFSDLNQYMEIVELGPFKYILITLVISDWLSCYVFEKLCEKMLIKKKKKVKLE